MKPFHSFRLVLGVVMTLIVVVLSVSLALKVTPRAQQNNLESRNESVDSTNRFNVDEHVTSYIQSLAHNTGNVMSEPIRSDSPMTDTTNSVSPSQIFQPLDNLQQYAQQCDQAIGNTVPDFICDNGSEAEPGHLTPANAVYPNGNCDRPNQLNQNCDPGSKFQMLVNNSNGYVAAHCRKKGLGPGRFGDIAVIQHNRNNGATCFYQALGNLDGNVKAPSKGGTVWPWYSPAATAGIGCAGCHDNGPLIRSPYLTQITGGNALPGKGDNSFNQNEPYYFVGADFANWKVYKVEIAGNTCNGCHRMGVNNVLSGRGTSLDFGIRATSSAASNPHKNSDSTDSPFWMLSGQTTFSQANYNAAQAIKACAEGWNKNPLPNSNTCKITLLACNANSDLYVDGAYRGAEQGTQTNPYRTITAAYTSACGIARIHIKAGAYPEVLTMSKNVTLLSEGGITSIGGQVMLGQINSESQVVGEHRVFLPVVQR